MEYRIYGDNKVYVYNLDKDPRIALAELIEITDSIVDCYLGIIGTSVEEIIEDIHINTNMTCVELEGEQNNSEVVPYDTDNTINDN